VPLYEFECEECGERFEELVAAGTSRRPCPRCGSDRAARRYSPQAGVFRLVKGRGDARKQEARNARLKKATKDRFVQARRKAREARNRARTSGPGGGGG
jgi:putative FmdB family regulatory protein